MRTRAKTSVIALAALLVITQVGALTAEAAGMMMFFANPTYPTQRLTTTGVGHQDQFGKSVAISGTTIVVGVPGHDSPASNAGAAYVFEYIGGSWTQTKKLTSPKAQTAGQFGVSVDIDGDTIVVGAFGEIGLRGAAYIFERISGVWTLTREIQGGAVGGLPAGARLGNAVATSGNYVAVGRPEIGAVYVFKRDAGGLGGWSSIPVASIIRAPGFGGDDIAMSGELLLISERSTRTAWLYDGGINFAAIKVLTTPSATEVFGFSVAIDGDTAAVGDPGADTGAIANHGGAYIYGRNVGGTNAWGLVKMVKPSEVVGGNPINRLAGWSVALGGDLLVVGAIGDDALGTDAGSAYVYQRNEGGANQWGETNKLFADSTGDEQHYFGFSAGATSSVVVVGAPVNVSGNPNPNLTGNAYVFELGVVTPAAPPAAPVAPTLTSPSGSSSDTTPTYTWDAVTDATSYQLQVIQSGVASIYSAVHGADSICSGGTCSVASPPAPTLAGGEHIWRVRAFNSVGTGEWSAFKSFTVAAPPTSAPLLTGPSGSSTDTTPSYTWSALSGATRYQLHLIKAGVSSLYSAVHDAAGICVGGICTIATPPAPTLTPGDHVWRVRALNAEGTGPWSAFTAFTVLGTTPAAPALIGPSGIIADTTPTYSWTESSGATRYQLHLIRAGVGSVYSLLHDAASICSGGTCTLTSPPLPTLVPGALYVWRVRGFNSGGTGDWSAFTAFSLAGVAPAAPVLTTPAGSIADTTPTYTWNAASGATRYQLHIIEAGVSAIHSVIYDASSICSGATCSVTSPPAPTLNSGSGYVWRVRGLNSAGTGAWSSFLPFSVQ